MKELSLHMMDIVQNSIKAGSTIVKVGVATDDNDSHLFITVEDNGRGMDEDTLKKSLDPFHTSRSTRKIGLGIPMFKEAAELAEGSFDIFSRPGMGTEVKAAFLNGSIDRQPLGDLGNVFFLNMISYEQMVFRLYLQSRRGVYSFDSREHIRLMVEGGMDLMTAAFEGEIMINQKTAEIFDGILPELGGDLTGIKRSRKTD